MCSGRVHRTTESFIAEMEAINPEIEILSEFYTVHTKVHCRCKKDGHLWWADPSSLLRGHGCPLCAGNENYTNDMYQARLWNVHSDIINTEPYTKAHTPIKFVHLQCGQEWVADPSSVLAGRGCPYCHVSKGEKRVAEYLSAKKIDFVRDKKFEECKHKKHLRFDFFLPLQNVAIEYDGQHHFGPVRFGNQSESQANENYELQKLKDQIKDSFCESNHIELLRIPYTEYDNILHILDTALQQTMS